MSHTSASRVKANYEAYNLTYPAGPAAIVHWPDPIIIVPVPSFVVEPAYVKLPF
jgi:hypothetical protein